MTHQLRFLTPSLFIVAIVLSFFQVMNLHAETSIKLLCMFNNTGRPYHGQLRWSDSENLITCNCDDGKIDSGPDYAADDSGEHCFPAHVDRCCEKIYTTLYVWDNGTHTFCDNPHDNKTSDTESYLYILDCNTNERPCPIDQIYCHHL